MSSFESKMFLDYWNIPSKVITILMTPTISNILIQARIKDVFRLLKLATIITLLMPRWIPVSIGTLFQKHWTITNTLINLRMICDILNRRLIYWFCVFNFSLPKFLLRDHPYITSAYFRTFSDPPTPRVEMGFTWTFPRNQDATVKLKSEFISIKF